MAISLCGAYVLSIVQRLEVVPISEVANAW